MKKNGKTIKILTKEYYKCKSDNRLLYIRKQKFEEEIKELQNKVGHYKNTIQKNSTIQWFCRDKVRELTGETLEL